MKHEVPAADFVVQAGHWLNRAVQGDRVEITYQGEVRAVLALPEFAPKKATTDRRGGDGD